MIHDICDKCAGPTYNYYCKKCYTENIYRKLPDLRTVNWKKGKAP